VTVWGAAAVERAAAEGVLRVDPGDVVTPLARDRAADLGVRILTATPAPPRGQPVPPPEGPGAGLSSGPPSNALYRRGAPVGAALRPPGQNEGSSGVGSPPRAVVVGAGHVGTITALRLAEADVFGEVVLVDVVDGLAAGVALDLTHTAALGGFATAVRGTTAVEEAGPAEYVVITAGRARQPGMSRSDLAATNAAIVGDIAARVAATSPEAVLLVVTNPLDEMTQHAWRVSGFPAARVLGMAGVLDTARFQALVGLTGLDRADRIDAVALGSHGSEMVIPLSQAAVRGKPLTDRLDDAAAEAIVARTRDSGAEVVALLKSGSAFLAPGTAAARMVLAMVADRGTMLPAAVHADGSYGIEGVYLGLPARLGRTGVREIVELPLAPDELAALREAAGRIRERLPPDPIGAASGPAPGLPSGPAL
jgi:malate dehydrogenase